MFGHTNSVTHCRFSPDDELLASCSADGTLKLWDVRSANEKKSINVKRFFLSSEDPPEDVEVIVKCCSWSADGDRIIVAAKNKVLVSPAILTHPEDAKLQPLFRFVLSHPAL